MRFLLAMEYFCFGHKVLKDLSSWSMLPKHHGGKAPLSKPSSRSHNGGQDENVPNDPLPTFTIPKGLTKSSIDSIPFFILPSKICRDRYTKFYRYRSVVLERQLHLDSFQTPMS